MAFHCGAGPGTGAEAIVTGAARDGHAAIRVFACSDGADVAPSGRASVAALGGDASEVAFGFPRAAIRLVQFPESGVRGFGRERVQRRGGLGVERDERAWRSDVSGGEGSGRRRHASVARDGRSRLRDVRGEDVNTRKRVRDRIPVRRFEARRARERARACGLGCSGRNPREDASPRLGEEMREASRRRATPCARCRHRANFKT